MRRFEQGINWERIAHIVEEASKHAGVWSDAQQRELRKIKKRSDCEIGKAQHGAEWAQLQSIDDLPKLRAVLDSYFEQVCPTLIKLLPEFQERIKNEQTLIVSFWSTLNAASKVPTTPQQKELAKNLFEECSKLEGVFSKKQMNQLKSWIEKLHAL